MTLLMRTTLVIITLFMMSFGAPTAPVSRGPLTVTFTPDLWFLLVLFMVLFGVVSGLITAFIIWVVKVRTMVQSALRFDMVMETASVDHQLGGELQLVLFSSTDQMVPSTVSTVYKRMSSCFRELGFQVFFSDTLQIELDKQPTLIAINVVEYKKSKKIVERFLKRHKQFGDIPVIFYNVEDPNSFDVGSKIALPYLLGNTFHDQELVKIAASVLESQELHNAGLLHGTITGDGISEILQFLELGSRSGLLTIRDSKKQLLGELGFHKGTIVYARSARGVGEIAAFDVAGFKIGFFSYKNQDIQGHNCQIHATALIMQLLQMEDEQAIGNAQV